MSGQYHHNIARRDAILATARMSPEAKARAMGERYRPPMAVPAVIVAKPKPPAPPKPSVLRMTRSNGRMWIDRDERPAIIAKAHDIIRVCCVVWGVAVDDVLTERRSRRLARPRQAAMHLMATHLRISQPSIAGFLKRDHTTVTASVKRRVPKMLAADREFRSRYRWAMRKLRRMWAIS